MQVVISIILYGKPFTNCVISEENTTFSNRESLQLIGLQENERYGVENIEKVRNKKGVSLSSNALFLQPFFKCMESDEFRINFLINVNKRCDCGFGTVPLKLKLEPPDQEIIDYAWNERLLKLIWTKVEIENAFSWLSTLGGAYSALGDYFEHCAEEAGRISVRQYKLSKLLGDEALAARSQLYSALAFAQKGYLKISRQIVRKINDFALRTKDKRLNRMCQGVWTKLRYMRSLVLQGKCSGDFISVNNSSK